MKPKAIVEQLAGSRQQLAAAIAQAVGAHWTALRTRGVEPCGYALLCNDAAGMIDVGPLAWTSPVYTCESDLVGERASAYFRYAVDEWPHQEEVAAFEEIAARLVELNQRFRELHPDEKGEDDFDLDAAELAHARAIQQALLQGLADAREAAKFGAAAPFLALWISDSADPIVTASVRRLNPPRVVKEFLEEFG